MKRLHTLMASTNAGITEMTLTRERPIVTVSIVQCYAVMTAAV
jgi:hypothetical protein